MKHFISVQNFEAVGKNLSAQSEIMRVAMLDLEINWIKLHYF